MITKKTPSKATSKSIDASAAVIPTEHQEQAAFVQWMRLKHPEHRIAALPNGGLRNIVTAVRLKKEGVVAGLPDLMIPSLHFFIEFKRRKGGSVSPEQRDWLDYLSGCGYHVQVCRGADEAISVIEKILK